MPITKPMPSATRSRWTMNLYENNFDYTPSQVAPVDRVHERTRPDRYNELIDEITSFGVLGDNWDGYGAVPVLPEIVEKVNTLINVLGSSCIEKVTNVFPNPHGTITIEWENNQREKLGLEIGLNSFSYFINYKNAEPKLADGKDVFSHIGEITSEINKLVG